MTKRTETILTVVLVAAIVVLGAVLVRNVWLTPAPPSMGPTVEPGETLALPESLHTPGRPTLLVALSPDCEYCDRSFPFYRELLERRDEAGADTRVVAAVGQGDLVQAEQQRLQAAGIHMDAIGAIDYTAAKIPGTPVIVALDGDGVVEDVWVGLLDARRRRQVVRVVDG